MICEMTIKVTFKIALGIFDQSGDSDRFSIILQQHVGHLRYERYTNIAGTLAKRVDGRLLLD